jgi:hypothetical protein
MDLLSLFDKPSGPVLEDFPDDEPESDVDVVLSCPVNYTDYYKETGEADSRLRALNMEISGMRSWYDRAVSKRNRTTVGVSRIDIENLGDFIYSFVRGEEPENPRGDIPIAYTLKFAVEDLRSYYVEGITAQPGQSDVSSQKLSDWFWDDTVAGNVLLDLKKVCENSEDRMMAMMGAHFIVPGDVARRNQE